MLNDDRAAKKAEELLPCEWECHITGIKGDHNPICPANFHPAVAAELSKAYAEIDRLQKLDAIGAKAHNDNLLEMSEMRAVIRNLKAEIALLHQKCDQKDDEYEQQCEYAEAEIARLRAELQHWREAAASIGQPDGHGWAEETKSLRAELASIEQFAEAWPCHCAENYPGSTAYHGHDCQRAIAQEFVAQWRATRVKA